MASAGGTTTRRDTAPRVEAEAEAHLESRRDRRRPTRRPWIIASAVLAVLLLGTAIFAGYLWNVSRAWEDKSATVDAANYTLGTRLANEQSEVVRLTGELDLMSDQLATAQQRITELADINAQAGDNVQYYVQSITELSDQLANATAVAAALNRCVEGKAQLVDYVRNAQNYDATDVEQFEASLTTLCANATAANLELQKAPTP